MNFFKSKQRDNPVVAYTAEPASVLLFTPSLKYRDVTAERKPRYVLRTTPRKGRVQATKLERQGGHLPGVTGIYAEVRNASLEIIGVSGSESVLEMRSTAEAPDHMQVRRLLDQVKIEMKGSRIPFFNPSNRKNGHCLTQFAITCPSERPVTVRGTYSAVTLSDVTGGADIETTHGRITILNVGPVVNARVQRRLCHLLPGECCERFRVRLPSRYTIANHTSRGGRTSDLQFRPRNTSYSTRIGKWADRD